MALKVYTQKEVNAIKPGVDGIRRMPLGAYKGQIVFEENCTFYKGTTFSKGCTFSSSKMKS